MTQQQNAVDDTQMKRLGEIDLELYDLGIFKTSPEVLFHLLEEHARLRLEIAVKFAPEDRRLWPIPADLDPAYLDRLEDYFESPQSRAHKRGVPGARIVVENIANDGILAAGQLQYAIEGRRLLAEGKTGEVALLVYASTREFYRYVDGLEPARKSVRSSQRVRPQIDVWNALGKKRERRLRELTAQGYTRAKAGQIIAKEEDPRATRAEIIKKGASIIRVLRRRSEKHGEAFLSPARQVAESTN
jgi:hypothetical protein